MSIDRRILSACIALYEERLDDVRKLLAEMANHSTDESDKPLVRWLEVCSQSDSQLRLDQLRHLKQTLPLDSPYTTLVESSLNLALEKQKLEKNKNTIGLNRTLGKVRNGKLFRS